MFIKDMFKKQIDRNIQGVIVVGEEGLQDEKSELEEYVVTKELQRHFKEFFENYKKGIVGSTRQNGVWISGFFGSGKSHFLKMLSYVLNNKLVEGKETIEYFKEDNKILDPMVMADMELAVGTPTDVILFNIDSKSEQSSKHTKDAIVNVFLKVFNEMQGFYGSRPNIADLERNLCDNGKYEAFQQAILSITGKEWTEIRTRFNFELVKIAKALATIDYNEMTEEAALSLCKHIMESPYQISIEDFARMVRSYIDKKGKNHHVVFCVDEVGQYIGDDSQMMLNLQTMREELGKECLGKAWVIVTSQQDIDSITNVKGNDFSKIQGRFDTRLSLSSANVDEVIRKRILEKTDVAAQTLRLLYQDKSVAIKNKIKFEKTPEMKLYENKEQFVDIYPFVPYQFNLLGKVLNSIRTHGASGKHLSEGERSMLALFKKSAMRLMDKADGALVPFYMFYDALDNFLDAVHSRVIAQALENRNINPTGEKDCFAVNVLKVLFLVKYVKELENTNLQNITSLMVSHVDEDIYSLTKQVEAALAVLKKETLIQEHSGNYVFLTEEEQEIGREIERQNVEIGEVQNKVSDLIFNDIYPESRYKYPNFNGRYTFLFNQLVDDRPHKANQNYDIGVHFITPYYTDYDERTLYAMSGQGKQVLVVLPGDTSFLAEITQYLKIEKYLQHNPLSKNDRYAAIKEAKVRELQERSTNAKLYLTDSLRNADIYVNGSKSEIKNKEIASRVNEALGKLVDTVYYKLKYIDSPMGAGHIVSLLRNDAQGTLDLGSDASPNKLAVEDVKTLIGMNSVAHTKTSLKTLKDTFGRAPYGFINDDVEWIVGKLFKTGDISIYLQQESITLINKSAEEVVDYLTNKKFVDKVMVEPKVQIDKKKVDIARDLSKELFDVTVISTDVERIMADFQKETVRLVGYMHNLQNNFYAKTAYPGQNVVKDGLSLLEPIKHFDNTMDFYKYLSNNQDELEEFAQDIVMVKEFFDGEQKKIFDDALQKYNIFEKSKRYIVDGEIENIIKKIQSILYHKNPYSMIRQLPSLIEEFNNAYLVILEEHTLPVKSAIEENKKQVKQALESKSYKDKYLPKFIKEFNDLMIEAESCNNINDLYGCQTQSEIVKRNIFKEMDALDAKEVKTPPVNTGAGIVVPIKPKQVRNYFINQLVPATSWRIESDEDVDYYVEQLREKLKDALAKDGIINIKF